MRRWQPGVIKNILFWLKIFIKQIMLYLSIMLCQRAGLVGLAFHLSCPNFVPVLTLYRTLAMDAVNLAKWCRAQGFVFGEMVVQTCSDTSITVCFIAIAVASVVS